VRPLPPALADHLAGGATTLCHCWKVTRRDGLAQGFTDHDAPLAFDGVTFLAETGLSASAMDQTAGLAVDNMSVLGALDDASISEAALAAGLYDDAAVEIWRVNWADASQRYLIRKGTIGEAERGPLGFRAELRGLAHALDQTVGRVYQPSCDAELGDARCGVDAAAPAFRGVGEVTAVLDGRRFLASGLGAFAGDWFSRGVLAWTGGANAGIAADVKQHALSGAEASFELWRPMEAAIAVGDPFTVTAGCDKRAATCKEKFSNLVNFRGFHLMPGNDFAQSYPNRGDVNDGGKRG